MTKDKSDKFYTLPLSSWDSYESKCIRNNALFEIGFIRKSNKQPDKFMVYPIKRELVAYHLVEHTLKNVESMGGYSRYNMECKPQYELELVKNVKGSPYAIYKKKQLTRKTATRRIKPNNTPITKVIL